jgi:hypothetical protein
MRVLLGLLVIAGVAHCAFASEANYCDGAAALNLPPVARVAAVNWEGMWNLKNRYLPGDAVCYKDMLWISISHNIGLAPGRGRKGWVLHPYQHLRDVRDVSCIQDETDRSKVFCMGN